MPDNQESRDEAWKEVKEVLSESKLARDRLRRYIRTERGLSESDYSSDSEPEDREIDLNVQNGALRPVKDCPRTDQLENYDFLITKWRSLNLRDFWKGENSLESSDNIVRWKLDEDQAEQMIQRMMKLGIPGEYAKINETFVFVARIFDASPGISIADVAAIADAMKLTGNNRENLYGMMEKARISRDGQYSSEEGGLQITHFKTIKRASMFDYILVWKNTIKETMLKRFNKSIIWMPPEGTRGNSIELDD